MLRTEFVLYKSNSHCAISLASCLRVSVAVKRHHDDGTSYKETFHRGGLLSFRRSDCCDGKLGSVQADDRKSERGTANRLTLGKAHPHSDNTSSSKAITTPANYILTTTPPKMKL